MMIQAGDWIRIESRKHDGSFHRAWKRSRVLRVTSREILVANRDVEVEESDGRQRISPGLALCQFHRNKWYNTILLYDEAGSHRWYCNIASPFRWSGRTLIYTDYDWDLTVDSTRKFRWLDREEFTRNSVRYSYPASVRSCVEKARKELSQRLQKGQSPFTSSFVEEGYHQYLSLKNLSMG
ncbi:DUF402 domain-containing protein [Desmospora profundinema]|nr:DUF402 domain-containing protein [Desmospora profundinema]